MAKILLVGIATLDIVNTVSNYPAEDSEQRALSQRKTRGGNATNTAVVLAQHGHDCSWAGVLIDEIDSQTIQHDLHNHHIDIQYCHRPTTGKMPTSYITLNQTTGSRTIVHYRDCPEFSYEQFLAIELSDYDWVHFEGRAIADTKKMLRHLKQHYPDLPCSLEVEKMRPDIESLFDIPDYLLFSKHYAEQQQFTSAHALLNSLDNSISATCTWGELGAWLKTAHNSIQHIPSPIQANLVDTLGAGDTFNAGLIDQLVTGKTLDQAVLYANQLASRKCGQQGFEQLLIN